MGTAPSLIRIHLEKPKKAKPTRLPYQTETLLWRTSCMVARFFLNILISKTITFKLACFRQWNSNSSRKCRYPNRILTLILDGKHLEMAICWLVTTSNMWQNSRCPFGSVAEWFALSLCAAANAQILPFQTSPNNRKVTLRGDAGIVSVRI